MSFSEWREVELEEVIELVIDYRGKTPKKLGGDWSQVGYRALSAKNIKTGRIVQEDAIRYLDSNLYTKWMKEEVNRGDILMTSEAPFGELLHWDSDEKIVLSQRLFCLRTNNKVDSKYLYYYMTTNRFQKELDARATGTTVRGLRQPQLLKCKIEYPPIKDQEAIANILSSMDEKIRVNNQINKNLENMAQAIFKQWFVDFEFPNEDGEPYKSSGGEMIESELGMIPKGWGVGNLAESKLTNLVKTGIAEFSGEKIYLATADVDKSNILSNTTTVTYNERPSRANMQPKENTVWFAKMKGSRKLIRVSRRSKDLIENYIFSTGFAGINVKEGLNYIWSFICSNDFDIRKNNLCHGTTMQAINNSNISNIPLLLPNEEILKKYEDITDYLFESEYLRKKENEKLAEIRDTLLPKLMSGEIRVPLDSEGDIS